MDWPAYYLDLNPIEHVWDALGRRIAARLHHPENTQQLKQMLIEEWALLPQEMLHQLVLTNMVDEVWHRFEAAWNGLPIYVIQVQFDSMPYLVRATLAARGGVSE
ncbi:transposable element Tc1 transposase [Trichonephila clavipes]|nr:transposable element Tc1 transposase [Trichonephila clavipes]